jgi:hypothetical protein
MRERRGQRNEKQENRGWGPNLRLCKTREPNIRLWIPRIELWKYSICLRQWTPEQ